MFGFKHYVILLMKVFVAYFDWSIIALNIQNTTFDIDICYDFIKDYTVNMAISISHLSMNFKNKIQHDFTLSRGSCQIMNKDFKCL